MADSIFVFLLSSRKVGSHFVYNAKKPPQEVNPVRATNRFPRFARQSKSIGGLDALRLSSLIGENDEKDSPIPNQFLTAFRPNNDPCRDQPHSAFFGKD